MQASMLYKIAIGTTKARLEKKISHLEFFEKHVFTNFLYTVVLIRTKNSTDHYFTKLVDPHQKLWSLLLPSEVISQ